MNIGMIFLNENHRLRSAWRSAVFLFAFVFIGIVFATIVAALIPQSSFQDENAMWANWIFYIFSSFIPAILVGWLCGKYLEDLPFRALGCWFTGDWFRHFLLGIVVGTLAISIAVVVAMGLGGLSFIRDPNVTGTALLESLAVSLFLYLIAATFEEAFFRGYPIQTFFRAGYTWPIILISSIAFGFVHLRNPSSNIFSTLNTTLAGVWFGYAYIKTRDLWFPIGMHLMWNWTQGSIFGIEVSGRKDFASATLLKEIDRGPAWLTGENYGIEGSIACTVAIIIAIALIHFLPVKANEEMVAFTSHEAETRV